ncbi:MAG: c-type cytochrome [Woeseiaceae bacterium]|nr:c-type cytochrome [Woeseiaceae bacterium]
MPRPFAFVLIAAVTLFAAARPTIAQETAQQGADGEMPVIVYSCLGCHGIEGYRNAYPSFRVPKIGGQKRDYLVAALKAYRAGTRAHLTMQAQMSALSDQEIDELATWFSRGEAAKDTVTSDDIAGIDAAATCLACHGAGSEGVTPTPPTLSGQHEEYLVYALQQYRNGNRPGNVMNAFAGNLSDEDMARIARFYSRREGLTTPDYE